MNAKICDRCLRTFGEIPENNQRYLVYGYDEMASPVEAEESLKRGRPLRCLVDLCSTCQGDLERFIKSRPNFEH